MLEFMKVYSKSIVGAISGWDRMRFRGTIRWLASTRGINSYLSSCSILMKDFGKWAEAITGRVRGMCQAQAEQLGIPTIYLRSGAVDKEAYARRIMQERGIDTGSICMFSVVEPCLAPVVRGNRSTKLLEVEIAPRKCVWIYHYWNDKQLGFGHTRLQTWLPLSVTVCINGRHWLERQLIREQIGYVKDGNCFPRIDDYERAEQLVEEQQQSNWSRLLGSLLEGSCPGLGNVLGKFPLDYYWSADETEWATDIVFRSRRHLDALFPKLARYGLLSAQSPAVMRFLGRSARGRCPDQVVSDLRSRYEGLRLKHWINNNSIKMYNKAGSILRIETTINQTRDFKVFRHPDDDTTRSASWQKMRKGVSDLHRRAEISQSSNERYLDHIAAASVAESLQETVGGICRRIQRDGKSYRAINPWDSEDFQTLQFLARGQFQLNGFRNGHLLAALYPSTDQHAEHKRLSGKVSRRLRLLRAHGLIQKVHTTNRYQLTPKGRRVATAVLAASCVDTQRLMEMVA
jgi:hypothetical protein